MASGSALQRARRRLVGGNYRVRLTERGSHNTLAADPIFRGAKCSPLDSQPNSIPELCDG